MPYTVEVPGRGVVEVPDDVPLEEASREIEKAFPPTGEEVASILSSNPDYVPTVEEFKLFKDYSAQKSVDWSEAIAQGIDSILQTAESAAVAGVSGAALNPANYLEGFAQGTQQMVDLVSQSQDPESPLFKFKNYITGDGSIESQRQQFIEARKQAKEADQYARGEKTFLPKELVNPEYVQGVAMVADPSLFFPGLGQVLGAEKVAAKAVGKAVQATGKAVQAVSRPVQRAAAAVGEKLTEAVGTSPEAMRGALATSGVLAATGAGPAVGLVGAIPVVAGAATDIGTALEAAGGQLYRAPTRIGALESIGKIPEANLRQRVIGTIGRYGGDAALNAALVGTTGSLEGAAIGGALGYLSGGEEGAAAGIGSGAAAGALGSLGARGVQTLTGQQARAARLNDLTTYIDTLPENKKAAYQSVQDRFGTDTASNLMDLETAIRGTRSDIAVDLLTGDEFRKQAGVTARGIVPQENAPTPRILINVDAFSRGKGDTPIYTLGHELVHALASTKQFQGDITALTERLTGAYIPNPDGTMRLTAEGEYTPAKVEELFNQYVNKLPDEVKAKAITDNPTAADRAAYVGEELVAEQVGRILSAQKPDAFLRGFGTTRQSFTDMLILQDASRAASRIGQYFEKTFGVTPSDSILFPEIKQSSPILDASLRQLLKARENISEALQKADFQKSFAVNSKNISDPTVADIAIRGGFAVREPDGTVRLLTNGELLERDQRDVKTVTQIVNQIPGARIDINGDLDGPLSQAQVDAINSSSVASVMKERISAVNQAKANNRSILFEYFPATEKVQDPQSKRWRTKYASRRVTFREGLPYNLLFSKDGNAYERIIDLTKIRSSLQKHVRNGGVAGLWPDVGAFMGDLAAYLTNRERGENAIPTSKLLGSDKAEFMGSFLNSFEKGGSEFIHAFRLDRFGKMDPGDFRARFGETGYQGMKNRLMPAGTVGDAEAFKSQSGYTVLSKNNKFRLYGPDGALLGIYDSSQKAEKKIYATQTRLQPEIDQQQRPARNEIGQTPEAGGRNRIERGTQGSQEGGEVNQQVRQAGDVGRFMPSDTDYLAAVQAGDTQAAQQMVDQAAKAAGYTTKVFHGSISQFNKPNTPLFLGDEGTAMSYAQDRAMAYGEGANPITYKLYAKFNNPASETDVKQAAMDLGLEVENDMAYTALDPQISGSRYVSRVISELKNRGYDSANIDDFSPDSAQTVIKSFVAFDPSQLKLSDPITRDDSGNVIPLSQRFQTSSADIRYMPSEKLESVVDGVVSEANRLGFEITDEHSSGFGSQYITIRDPESNREWKMRFSDHERQLSSVTQHAAPNFEQVGNLNLEKAIIWLRKKRETIENPPQIDAKQYEKQKVAKAADEVLMYEQKIRDLEANRDKRISQGNTKKAANLQTQIDQIKNSMGYKSALNEANQPRYMPQPDPSVPGAYSVTGGFRILPGKTGGRLRVYGPSGELIGIVGGMDEAQRMIRKKNRF